MKLPKTAHEMRSRIPEGPGLFSRGIRWNAADVNLDLWLKKWIMYAVACHCRGESDFGVFPVYARAAVQAQAVPGIMRCTCALGKCPFLAFRHCCVSLVRSTIVSLNCQRPGFGEKKFVFLAETLFACSRLCKSLITPVCAKVD
jgi:hypothetical protein